MKLYLTGFLILIAYTVFAQSNYHPGYVVKTYGDTIKGYVDYREWDHTPTSIHFKTSLTDKNVTEFSPKTIKMFEISGMERYISYSGLISMDKTRFPDLPTGLDTNKLSQTIFLRQVTTGKHLALYQQKDYTKSRFFITEEGGPVTELKYYQYYADDNTVAESTLFRGQLAYYSSRFDAADKNLISFIERAQFIESSLNEIIDKINGESAGVTKKTGSKAFRFFAGLGASYTQTEFFYVNYAVSSYSVWPRLNAGFDVFVNPNVQQLILRAELAVNYANPNFVLASGNTYTFKQYTAAFTPQILFNVYNKDAFKIYLDGGMSFNFSGYANNMITYPGSGAVERSPFQLEPYWASFPLQTGVVINKKLEFSLTYMGLAAYTKYTQLSISNRTLSAGFKYLLGK